MRKPSGGKGSSDFVLCGTIDPSPKGEAKERKDCPCERVRGVRYQPTTNDRSRDYRSPRLDRGVHLGKANNETMALGYRSGDGCHTGSSPAQAGQAVAKRVVVPWGTFLLSARPLTQILRKICASPTLA